MRTEENMRTLHRRLTALALCFALVACTHAAPDPAAPVGGGVKALNLGTQKAAITLASGSNNDVEIAVNGNTTTLIKFAVDAAGSTLSGMKADKVADGDLFFIRNNSATGNLTITNADTASAAANRFLTPGTANVVVPPRGGLIVEYDAALGWTVLSPHGSPFLAEPTVSGKVRANGTGIPVLSSCGSTPSPSIVAGSTDFAGQFTTGGTDTDCVLTFASTWTTAPACQVGVEGSATQPTFTVSATAITFSTNIAQTKYNYICVGR